MKLSDIKGDRVFDVLADIVEPAFNIATDKTASALFRQEKRPEGMDPKEFALDKLKKALPALLRGHKRDLMAIMAAVNGVGVDELESNLTMTELIKGLVDICTDDELIGFLS